LLHVIASFLLLLGANQAAAQTALALPCPLEPGPTRAVADVIDGDTVRLDDGIELRLLGILAPRARDADAPELAGQWPPATDAKLALRSFIAGQSVSLAFSDIRNDRYGRVLAHLFADIEGQRQWVQGQMIKTGRVRAHALPDSANPCLAALTGLEREARASGSGLWSHAAYQVRPADRPSELLRYRHSYQLVRGRVENIRTTSRLIVLTLANGESPTVGDGRPRRNAFQVVWRRSTTVALRLPDAKTLVGRNVLARGWIEASRGPEIELIAAGQMEFEDRTE